MDRPEAVVRECPQLAATPTSRRRREAALWLAKRSRRMTAAGRARELTVAATSSRTARSLKADIRSTTPQRMSTEQRDQSDSVRALKLTQLTGIPGLVVVADE